MFGADAAVVWAAFHGLGSRILHAVAVVPELLRPLILFVIRPIQFFEYTMFWAFFLDEDLAAVLENRGVQRLKAFGADTLRVLNWLHVSHWLWKCLRTVQYIIMFPNVS